MNETNMSTPPIETTDNVETSSQDGIDFDVQIADLVKYTKNLEIYDQESLKAYRKFEKQLSNVIKKLAFASNDFNTTLEKIMTKELRLSRRTSAILTFILSDALDGPAAIPTKAYLEENHFIEAFEILKKAWPQEEDNLKGAHFRKKLLDCKYQPGQTIEQYNQDYLPLFNESVRLGRYSDGINAVDDYFNSLPLNTGIVANVVQIASQQNFEALLTAMEFMASSIRRVRTSGIILEKKDRVLSLKFQNNRRSLKKSDIQLRLLILWILKV